MGLMPVDIYNKEFSKGLRGYNVDEVNDFLDQIMKDYEMFIKEKKGFEEKIEKLEERIAHFSSIEETLNKSIMVAQETSERVKVDAEKEADITVKDAQKEANRIINSAMDKGRQVELEIESLKNGAKVFRNRYRMLLESHLSMIENDDWDDLQESVKRNIK